MKLAPLEEAHALASKVLPVPGGPYNKIPLTAFLGPVKNSGRSYGSITAFSKDTLALLSPIT